VERLEGNVNQYMGDGVMALFGAPLAIEDGPRRAVQAALDIQRVLRELSRRLEAERRISLQMRIGLHTGTVVVGSIGDDWRMDYTAMGDTTTIAARLQQSAEPGRVLISAATHHLVAGFFETVDRGELLVKGHAAPVHAFEVVRARARRDRVEAAAERGLTPLVGREHELAVLLERFAAAKRGRGQAVFLTGEAGIGKSRLVHELRVRLVAAGEPIRWIEGRCVSFGRAIPLLPVTEQVRDSVGIEEHDAESDLLAKLDDQLERLGTPPAIAPYLRALLVGDGGEPALAGLDPALRRTRTFDALRALTLAMVRERPTVLVFEDLHWSDRSTEEYLATLLPALGEAPVLLVATHRADYTPPFGDPRAVTTLRLPSLRGDEALAIAAAVLGTDALPAEVAAALTEKAEGVPLFIEEVSKTLLDLGVLRREADGTQLARRLDEVDIPETIEGIIMARLDRLGEQGKRTVQLASVIGRHFLKRLLERVAELPQRVDGLLAELKRLEIVYEQGQLPEPAYVFKHAVIQDVAYNSLLLQRRKELHRAVGRAIEELYGDRLAEHYGELAHHFLAGEEWASALAYAERAGDAAVQTYANVEAQAHYRQALAAAAALVPAPDAARLIELHVKLGRVLATLGDYAESIAQHEQALGLAERAGDPRREADVLLALSEAYLGDHRPGPSMGYCDRALAIGESLGDYALQAVVLATRANYLTAWHGPVVEARRAAKASLELAEHVENPVLRARTHTLLGSVLQWRGDLEACLPYLREGALLAERLQSSFVFGQALFHLGNAHLSRGQYAHAQRRYEELARYAAEANDPFWQVRVPNTIGGVHLELYDLAEAIRCCEEGDEIARRLYRWPEPRGHALVKLGLAHLYRGDHGAADAALRQAESLLDADEWARWRWHIALLRARAELALAVGQLDDAWRFAGESLELATRSDSRKHIAHARIALGTVAAAQERWPEAAQLLRAGVTQAEHIGAAREIWLGCRALAGALLQLGREREAEGYLTEAAQTIEAIARDLQGLPLRTVFLAADPVREVYRMIGKRPPP
jgi:tetratricopeptide (TPR) repeat protein